MVFSSIPLYLDPSNWHQQSNQYHQANVTSNNHELLPPLPPQPKGSGYGGESIRPGPIADQGNQLTKMALPDQVTQKCPRCESTNTKFCYYNNYNLSQPRHFCKTCRRYWTKGGALRNVPVGGGCRRNKKNKRSSSSKSPSSIDKNSSISNSTSATNPLGISTPNLIGRFPQQQSNHQPFMASLQNLNRYSVGNMSNTNQMEFQIGGRGLTSVGGGGGVFQHFPFLNGFESTSAASYPFQSENVEAPYGLVKFEDLNPSRNPLSGVSENNNQYYSWTDLSGLAPSSTTHLL
ncbi:hypothetical protein TanjilG_11313 [Lupinus angustifolius]|uniref:Dof zinc finger protein n=1 Tax=Lupinus angustifolius TaxID=3871 RepID=A0A1J7H8F1_LUPAN|nr:PREDICTED: dof zinc finger protein DOF3.6-like [Lupinus angustifolius]OIW09175.1 hypothetical protein TanjilG_11313 [Lupinus angustifolius]